MFSLIWCLKRSSSRQRTCINMVLLAKWFWKSCFRGKTKTKTFSTTETNLQTYYKSIRKFWFFSWAHSKRFYTSIEIIQDEFMRFYVTYGKLMWCCCDWRVFFSVCMRRERRKSTDFSSTQVKTNWEHFISTFILEKKDSKSLSIWSACWKWLFYFTINRKAFLHLRDKFQQLNFFLSWQQIVTLLVKLIFNFSKSTYLLWISALFLY